MKDEYVYIVVGWLHDMCDDGGIPETSVFSDLTSAEIYELFLAETGASITHIYKRKIGAGVPFGYESGQNNRYLWSH